MRIGSLADLDALAPLWRRFYEDQRAQGMRAQVPNNGFEEWAGSMRAALGRFACLIVAQDGPEIVGFVAGRVRGLPRYLGGASAGWISEVWVEPTHRKLGLAEAMVRSALDWFGGQGMKRIELQLVTGNAAALELYKRLGFAEELVQMVLEAPPRASS
ncbi:MAG: GNAT family N-acetyltransferase [Gemmatimonadales bacterium]